MSTGGPAAPGLDTVRRRLGSELFARVAGPHGPAVRSRIHETPGPRWFGPERPIRAVHGDASMFVGGVRALLLQSLHPVAMAAVAAHSGYRSDPWGRLQRTSTFLAVTTFGTADDARRAVDRVREVHERIRGTAPSGQPYRAADPHLLGWVHAAEVDSFLRAHRRYGAEPLDEAAYDGYVEDAATVAAALGVVDPPRDQRQLAALLAAYRAELRGTAAARDVARFILLRPPLPWAARPAYGLLAAAAVGLLPGWARRELHLPWVPVVEDPVVRLGGLGVTRTIRWAMTPPPEAARAVGSAGSAGGGAGRPAARPR
ncbi:oxygenase MpaB family protein [Kitasatospora sp. NPDC047058]|uniref:oxygenase MpaB family protein n=1 Tax=Kitasatospora sp. NPDC047058 TaxID=3155620 RepID=UPI0033E4680A